MLKIIVKNLYMRIRIYRSIQKANTIVHVLSSTMVNQQ